MLLAICVSGVTLPRLQCQTTGLERTSTRNNWLSKALGFKNIVSLLPFYLFAIFKPLCILRSCFQAFVFIQKD